MLGPSSRDQLPFNLHLLGQYMVPDLFSILANIRALAKHALICDHTHCEVVYCHAVILPAHNLGSHVARCTRCVLRVLRVPDASDSEISDAQIALLVKHEVFRLYISV